MTQSASNTFMNIITAPKQAFPAIKEKPSVLFPLGLILAAAISSMVYFYATVDFAWMIEQMVNAQTAGKTDAEREAMHKAMSSMSSTVMGVSSVAGLVIGISIFYSIMAAYLMLVNKLLDSDNLGFKAWFSFICWCSIPAIFTSLASLINVMLASNGQITLESLNPISFNNLFLHIAPNDPLFGPINAWDPMMLWSMGLMIFGFNQWTGKSLAKSAAIVLAPSVIIYGIWIAVALK
ncbi:hypothetical protein GCM10011613_27390 [Cellvibrio zantedeschiae]|uniref:Yip1 domain-containing protein n=1 Tax=Cellvibrio zantedeschiae TaxID=1237077 RepID=A0ABQ3B5Q5_9GAMM|nr:YIP1 family protein [Cellvibrio zantedeschiae]GGY80860.1 hypothetical protein GCM10011613_27390 [Cellvibrio zantedeschiae]